jgi:hypothetical protein
MSDTVKPKMSCFLKAELVILACAICIWIITSVTVDIDSTKAAVTKQVVRTKPNSADSSKETHRINVMESGFTEGTPQIQGIGISGSGESLIMIEGEIFHEGNFVKGFKIKKIDGRTVEFQKDGKIWVQHMD